MKIGRIVCLCLLLANLLVLLPSGAVLAQEEEKVELEATYGKLEATSPGASFEFEVSVAYQGSKDREFDLSATGPQGWSLQVKPSFGEQIIGSIRVEPNKEFPDRVKITARPPFFPTAEPGEYTVSLEASSGSIRGSIDLTAVISATYAFNIAPTTERLNTIAMAGKDNIYSIVLENVGSGTLESIKFSSSKPQGWSIEFSPEEIDELSPGSFQTVDVNIKPAPKAIAGDYPITLVANAKPQTRDTIDVRVTVQTSTIWGWVGLGIILLVIAGVVAVFMRFSRR